MWHLAVAAFAAFALVGQTALGITDDRSLINLFSYFTIQSNILILVASLVIAVSPERGGGVWAILRLAGLVGITVTGVVYATVLAGIADFSGIEWWYDKILHYAVPIGAMLGFFFFVPRTRFARSDLVFIAWPIVWLAYTLVRGGTGNPSFAGPDNTKSAYPYDFLDVDKHGGGQVALNAVAVTFLMLGVAALYVRLSNRSVSETV